MSEGRGAVRFYVARGGTPAELAAFLRDIQRAYIALYSLPRRSARLDPHYDRLLWGLRSFRLSPLELLGVSSGRDVPPDDWIEVTRISISSPGFFEMCGAIGPLKELREYLKDRHERRKDRDWRESSEKERALLENEILREEVRAKRISRIRNAAELLKDFGMSEDEVQTMLWDAVGRPLAELGKHQDSGLLTDQRAEPKDR